MKLGKRKWARTGTERGGFDESLLRLGGPGGGASRRSIKKPKTNVNKTGKADSTISGVSEMGSSIRSAKLQSRKSGPNIAGDARHKVLRDDLTSPSGADFSKRNPGAYKPDPTFIKKQKRKEAESKKRIEKERIKEKIGGMVKRAKRDKELEAKIGKKGLKEAKKAYEGLYGNWLKNQGFSPESP